MNLRRPGAYLRDGVAALISTASAAGACATVWWLGSMVAGGDSASVTSAAVLATVVALSLGRRTFASRAEFLRSAAALPVIGLLAGIVGWLLLTVPPLGAALFVAGMSVPIWLRRFDNRLSRLGALASLPFIAVLVAPVVPAPGAPVGVVVLFVVGAGVIATLWVALAREAQLLLPHRDVSEAPATPPPANRAMSTAPAPAARVDRTRRLPASTRMALQMAAALTAAFILGGLVFPDHAMWVVLTAFLVCSGNRGRADVVHKSGLRVAGALGGTLLAVVVTALAPHASGFGGVVLIFVALFAGTWLRDYSYAFWALVVTLVLTLLQQLTGTTTVTAEAGMLTARMLAIVLGAALGVAASWFILPVRSVDVLRRRLSEMLIALGAALRAGDPSARDVRVAAFTASLARVEQLAPAHRAMRRIRRGRGTLPIDCIDAASALSPALDAYLANRRRHPGQTQRDRLGGALADARRSLAEPVDPERIRSTLDDLATAMRRAEPPTGD